MTRWIALCLLLAACGGTQQPAPAGGGSGGGSGGGDPPIVAKDTLPEIARRRDAACRKLEPRLVQCAVDDARVRLAEGKITPEQFEEDTSPKLQRGLAQDWRTKCLKGYMSSRQVRVLEVCFREETACAALEGCLLNLKPAPK